MTTEYIDATPSTEACFRMLIEIVKHGNSQNVRWAEEELMRYAKRIDQLKASVA